MKFVFTMLLLAALPLLAQAALSNDDTTYLTSAIQSQLGRYALASLAQKNSDSSRVKSLAKTIATQATAGNRQLTSLAKANGVAVPTSPSVRFNYHYSELTGLHGKAFDREFVQDLSTDDQLAQGNDQTEMHNGSDPRLKDFAKKRYSSLQKELQSLGKIHS